MTTTGKEQSETKSFDDILSDLDKKLDSLDKKMMEEEYASPAWKRLQFQTNKMLAAVNAVREAKNTQENEL